MPPPATGIDFDSSQIVPSQSIRFALSGEKLYQEALVGGWAGGTRRETEKCICVTLQISFSDGPAISNSLTLIKYKTDSGDIGTNVTLIYHNKI